MQLYVLVIGNVLEEEDQITFTFDNRKIKRNGENVLQGNIVSSDGHPSMSVNEESGKSHDIIRKCFSPIKGQINFKILYKRNYNTGGFSVQSSLQFTKIPKGIFADD